MAKLNKECILCKTKYSFCNRCAEYDHLPRWMGIYCSDNCRTIFMTLTDYSFKHLSKEDAKRILDTCDLSKKDVYHESTQKILNEVYTEELKCSVVDAKSDSEVSNTITTTPATNNDLVTDCATISTSDYSSNIQVSLTNSMSVYNGVDDIVKTVEKTQSNKKIKSKKNADIKQK